MSDGDLETTWRTRGVGFSPSGEVLVAETSREDGSQGVVRTWEATTGREPEPLVSDERGPVVGTAFSPTAGSWQSLDTGPWRSGKSIRSTCCTDTLIRRGTGSLCRHMVDA